jgi:hypothetical protein
MDREGGVPSRSENIFLYEIWKLVPLLRFVQNMLQKKIGILRANF